MRQDLLTLAATCPISSDRSRPRQEWSQKAIPISTKHKQESPFFHLGNSTHTPVPLTSHMPLSPLCKWVVRMCNSTHVLWPSIR